MTKITKQERLTNNIMNRVIDLQKENNNLLEENKLLKQQYLRLHFDYVRECSLMKDLIMSLEKENANLKKNKL